MTDKLETQLSNLGSFLHEKGWTIFSQTEIEHGIKVIVTNGIERIPVNFYNTGTINVQGKKGDLQSALKEWANIQRVGIAVSQNPSSASFNRSARFLVFPDKMEEIRTQAAEALPGEVFEKDVSGTAEVYRLEIRRDSERVTLTQYRSGTLLVQGLHSPLFDEACETMDQFLTQSFEDRTRRFLPGEETRKTVSQYLESGDAENEANDWLLAQIDNNVSVLGFMYENDRMHLLAASGVRNAIKKTNAMLPDYSVIVMPFGKPLEGYIIKLAAHLELAEEAILREKANTIEIGNWLDIIQRRLPDQKRYGEVADTLKAAWQCRNKAMHSDFVYPNTINSFAIAEQEIFTILRAINRSYRVFVLDGVKLKLDTSHSKQKAHLSEETKFEGVDRKNLLARLQAENLPVTINGKDKKNVWELITDELKIFAPRSQEGLIIVKGKKAQGFCSKHQDVLLPKSEPNSLWIGVDESGKGDVFGPLVIASAAINPELEVLFAKNGVRDSKDLSDFQVRKDNFLL